MNQPKHTIGQRFAFERRRLGFHTGLALAEAIEVTPSTISKTERDAARPGCDLMAAFCQLGADINFVLTGIRSAHLPSVDEAYMRERDQLDDLFGAHRPHMAPAQLLGALLCVHHAGASYRLGANPYPPRSPHHHDVQIGWELAHRASDALTQHECGAGMSSFRPIPPAATNPTERQQQAQAGEA